MSEKPQPDVSRETRRDDKASPAKNKPSSFYLYLLILFGAAFLMLLLAYFVQRRNNETTITDLRNTMNLSREELLEEISRLEGEITALHSERDGLKTQLDELQKQMDEQTEQSFWRERELEDQVISWNAVYGLEQGFRTEAYDRCVVFFENALTAVHYATPPEAAERVEEIYWALVEKDVLNEEDFPLATILGPDAASTPAPEMG